MHRDPLPFRKKREKDEVDATANPTLPLEGTGRVPSTTLLMNKTDWLLRFPTLSPAKRRKDGARGFWWRSSTGSSLVVTRRGELSAQNDGEGGVDSVLLEGRGSILSE